VTEKKSSVQPTTQRLRSLSMVMVVEPFAKRKSRQVAANSKGKRQRTVTKTYRKTETSGVRWDLIVNEEQLKLEIKQVLERHGLKDFIIIISAGLMYVAKNTNTRADLHLRVNLPQAGLS
jgi:hypothetical protein